MPQKPEQTNLNVTVNWTETRPDLYWK